MYKEITYSDDVSSLVPEKVSGFFVEWGKRPSGEMAVELLKKSDFVVVAMDKGGRVIGFVTAITDGVLAAYVPFLEVLPEFQGRGIGAALFERMMVKLKELYMVDLLCDAELQGFYEKHGMRKAQGMMVRRAEGIK